MTLAAQIEALAPCPVCGGEAKMIHPMGAWESREIGYGPNGSRVICSNDDCPGKQTFYGESQDAEAIAAWNTRPAIVTALRQAEGQGPRYSFGHCKDCPGDHSRMCCKTQTSEGSGVPAEAQYSYETLKLAHDMTHEAATSMGYPSATEALEHLSELRDADALRQAEGEGEIALPHRPSISLARALEALRAGDERNWTGAIYDHLRNYAALLENRSDHSLRQAEAAPGVVEFLEAWLSDVQRAALRGAMLIGGEWVLTTDYEDDPDIIESLSEKLADPVSGILTPLGALARETLARQHGAREGYVLVPREPTEAMLAAAKSHNEGVENANEDWDDCHRKMWSAMIDAVPATDVGEAK